jgi:GntR family histidine utilization transcriptional repressor
VAKYQDIQAELIARITSGAWPPGSAIPHEAELARAFGTSRPTVARALSDLVKAGLVERRRRAGSRVAEARAREQVLTIPRVRAEIEASGAAYGYRLISRRRARPPAAVRAHLGEGPALHLVCLHSASGRPHQLEDRWISLAAVPEAAAQDFTASGPNDWLVATVPFTRAEHTLAAAAASPAEAAALDIAPGDPVFVIGRTTWLGSEPVTSVRLVHPGAGYRLVTRDAGPA